MKIMDLHCDTVSELLLRKTRGETVSLRENSLHLDLKRMRESGYSLQTFALFLDRQQKQKLEDAYSEQLQFFKEEMEKNADWIRPVFSYSDICGNEERGCMSALLSVEEGAVTGGRPEVVSRLYQDGVRMMTLTWNYENELGYPNRLNAHPREGIWNQPDDRGLKAAGLEVLAAMEQDRMLVDVSHLSDGGFWDVVKHTRRPFLASHSNARAIASHVRNLTDEMIRALAERGGIIGLNYCVAFLEPGWQPGEDGGRLCHMAAHARHIVQAGGFECLGLGSDFDGIQEAPEMGDCAGINQLAEELSQNGFHESEIEKILGGNVRRFLRENL